MSEAYLPYVVQDSGHSVEEVIAAVNEAQWYGYGPDYRAGGIDKVIAGPLIDFETFLRDLIAADHLRFVTHRHLAEHPDPDPSVVRVAIRHDIDSDIVSALAQAEIEQRLGVVATWLVLHTAPYYGSLAPDGTFLRNDAMGASYRRLQDLGHEVSLHTDPLGLYQLHGVDGAAAVTTELAWLRAQGIDIVGTTAHNHRSTYGAENFEVFSDYVVPGGGGQPADATQVEHDGASAPLRVLDATTLGLRYEGNQILWRRPELDYCSARFVNEWAAPWFRRQKVGSQRHELRFVDQDRVVEHLRALAPGQDAVVVIHPEYFGARAAIDQGPLLKPETVGAEMAWPEAGWLRYEPWSVIVESALDATRPTVGIAVANEWGRRGLPVLERLEATDPARRMVVIGGEATAARNVAVPAAWPERTARLLTQTTGQRWSSFVLAEPSMGIDRLWPWLEFGREQTDATTIIIEVPPDVDADIGVQRWGSDAQARGATGTYLVPTPGGVAKRRFGPESLDGGDPRSGEERCEPSDGVALYSWCVTTLVERGCAVVLVLTDQTGGVAPGWVRDLSATSKRVRVAGPVPRPTNGSALGHHRVLSEAVATAVRALVEEQATPDETTTDGRVSPAPAGAEAPSLLELDASDDRTDLPPDAEVLVAHANARSAIGLRTYPIPFDAVVSFISDIDGSTTPYYLRYIFEMVHDWGLDFGDSIHFAGYHQRYAIDRRRRRSRHRAILNYQLRLDNSPIGLTGSWLAHVLRCYHRGDIDHLHGLYSWGARTMSMSVTAHPTAPRSSRAVNGYANANRSRQSWRSSLSRLRRKVPYSVNAEYFPVISCAIRTRPGVLMPDRVTARWAETSIEMRLSHHVPGPEGTRTSVYTTPVTYLEVMDLNDQPVLHPQRALLGVDIELDPDEILAVALHNTDAAGVVCATDELRRRYRLAFDLLTTHGHYHFYPQGHLESMSKRALKAQEKSRPDPVALYGAPLGTDAALAAIADAAWSPAAVQAGLIDKGLRFLTPIGYIARGQDPFDPAEVTFPVIDRSGNRLWYLQRCLPRLPRGAPNPNTSRLSTFEVRLENLLDDLDERVRSGQPGGFWPFYTHLGQTADLDEEPDPWFGGQGLAAVAQRFWGAAQGPRPWITRASVMANYSQVLQRLPALTRRDGDRIDITNAASAHQGDRPLRPEDLFGVTFDVADPDAAAVYLDGNPITELRRWSAEKAVTVVACGIRWPIIDAADPRELAAIGGDFRTAEVASGEWVWHEAQDRSARYGSLTVGGDGVASLRIELGDLDVSGAQVASIEVRANDDVTDIEVGLVTASGEQMLIANRAGRASQHHESRRHGLGQIVVELPRQQWVRRHLPLWAATDVEELPRSVSRSIRTIDVRIAGRPGAQLDIASLWLGRPKTNTVQTEPGVLIGGEARTLEWVDVVSLDGIHRHRCAVEPTGVFVSPKLEPGAWTIEAPGMGRRALQVDTDRFDVVLGASELANPRARPNTKTPQRGRWRLPRRR